MTRPIVVVGSLNIDLVVTTERHPRPGETLTGSNFEIFTGGKGANQAVAAARLGHPVHMIGKVGSDTFSTQLRAYLESAGVFTDSVSTVEGTSGVALINRTASGENTIVVVPGANHALKPSDMERHRGLIASSGLVLTQLEIPLETLEALCRITSTEGVPLMLDPAPAQPLKAEVLKAATWITPNEVEAEQLTGKSMARNLDAEARQQAEILLEAGAKNVLLKLGERGAFLATGDIRVRIPPWRVNAVDTTGAGDAFNAAFATGLLRDMAPVKAAQFASAVAALSVTRPGAQAMPTQSTVDEFMKSKADEFSQM